MMEGSFIEMIGCLKLRPMRLVQKINLVLMKLDVCSVTMASSSCLLASVCLVAIMERIEKDRRASVTDNVPSAEVLSPGEGKHVRPALALGIDVHPADLVDERIHQTADLIGT